MMPHKRAVFALVLSGLTSAIGYSFATAGYKRRHRGRNGRPALWDDSNIIESYSGVTTPMTFSFARMAYENVYREFCRLMRVPQRAIEANAEMFCCMIGLIRGRVYYNL